MRYKYKYAELHKIAFVHNLVEYYFVLIIYIIIIFIDNKFHTQQWGTLSYV
jgi:hypothetical protein